MAVAMSTGLMPWLALLPILLLVVLSLWRGVREAVLAGLVLTTGLFFWWGADVPHYLAALGVSLLTTLNILLIVFGAAFLYTVMQRSGLIDQIGQSLNDLHPAKEVRFFLLALCLTAFFEGVAGFGTPGAIVPLILIAMGFEALPSLCIVLLFDSLFSAFGAVGVPLHTGLQLPLGLDSDQAQGISLRAALCLVVAGAVLLPFVFRLFERHHGKLLYKRQVWVLYSFFAVPFVGFAYLASELATVLGALVLLGASVFYLRQGPVQVNLRPWVPYAVLALFLLLPKVVDPLRQGIGLEMAFPGMFGTDIRGGIRPLQSPLIPFVVVALGVIFVRKGREIPIVEPLKKCAGVLMVLFPSVAIAQLMIYSGVAQPSMVQYISGLLSSLGPVYVFLAPFLGIMGTFITGSTTISNVVFGPSQAETAAVLGLGVVPVLALQLAGASLGNAICLFNIIAAASIANVKNYRQILANNLLPTLTAGAVVGLLGYLLVFVF